MVTERIVKNILVKNARTICLVSSAVFNLSACVNGWMAPVAAALGCVADLVDDKNMSSNKENLDKAIDRALERTRESCLSESQRSILSELCEYNVEINSLRDLIKKTEAYQTRYCTDGDTKEIVNCFEMHFRDCISEIPELSRLYILSTGIATLEEIKKICEIVYEEKQDIDAIHKEVLKTNKFLDKAKQVIKVFAYEASYVLAAMAVFLLVGVFSRTGYPHFWIYAGLISYSISSFLTYNTEKDALLFKRCSFSKRTFDEMLISIVTIIIRSLTSVSCFLILVWSTSERNDSAFHFAIMGIIYGSMLTQLIKFLSKSGHERKSFRE